MNREFSDAAPNGTGTGPAGHPLIVALGDWPDDAAIIAACTAVAGGSQAPEPGQHTGGLRLIWRGIDVHVRIGSFAWPDDWQAMFCAPDRRDYRALRIGFGPHAGGGERVRPVLAALLDLGVRLSGALETAFVGWGPARLVTAPAEFREAVAIFASGGPFPALGLVRLHAAPGQVMTEGLATFCGQELDVVGPGMAERDLVRRAVRIVHGMATEGPIVAAGVGRGLIEGETVEIVPPAGDGSRVRATIASGDASES